MTGDNPASVPDPAPYYLPPAVNIAEIVRQANTYYNNGQYSNAVPLYEQAANTGNASAQSRLGNCYFYVGFRLASNSN